MVVGESSKCVITDHSDRTRRPAIKNVRVRIIPPPVGVLLPPEEPRQLLGGQDGRRSQESLNISLRNKDVIFGVDKKIISILSFRENAPVSERQRMRIPCR